MATTPAVAPATPPTTSPLVTIERDITWIRGHVLSVLLSLALIAGCVMLSVSWVQGLIEKHDERAAAAQQAKEGVSTQQQAALLAQLQQIHNDDVARDQAQQAQIQTLITQMAQQHAVTAKQLQTDASLNAQAAAARLVSQTKASVNQVTVANDLVTMDLPLTRVVIADLDLLPQAQNDVTNLNAQLDAQKILTTDAQSERDKAQQVITADKTELIATIKADNAACKVQVDAQASKDRKRGFWVAVASTVFGIVVGNRL
jgi:hypothetical protein